MRSRAKNKLKCKPLCTSKLIQYFVTILRRERWRGVREREEERERVHVLVIVVTTEQLLHSVTIATHTHTHTHTCYAKAISDNEYLQVITNIYY